MTGPKLLGADASSAKAAPERHTPQGKEATAQVHFGPAEDDAVPPQLVPLSSSKVESETAPLPPAPRVGSLMSIAVEHASPVFLGMGSVMVTSSSQLRGSESIDSMST